MRWRVIVFLAMLPVLLLITVWQVRISTDISSFFIAGNSPQAALVASNMQTGEISRRYLLSIGSKQGHVPLDAVETLHRRLAAIPGVARVWGRGRGAAEMQKLVDFYLPWRYALYSLQPETDVTALFSAVELHKRAMAVKQALLSPMGAWVQPIVMADPLFLSMDWLHQLPSVKAPAGKYVSMVVQTTPPGLDTAEQAPIDHRIHTVFAKLNAERGGHLTLQMTGVPVFAMAAQKQVAGDVGRVGTISSLLMVLFFLLMFRSVRALVMVIPILLAAAMLATLSTSLLFGRIDALTLAIGTTLIGICVDYPIHTMVHAAADTGHAEASTRVIWPSLLMGALTTIVGYAALSLTGYPGMQQIAVYAAIGILTSLLLARYVLPHAIAGGGRGMHVRFPCTGWLRFVGRHRLQAPVLIVALVALVVGLLHLRWVDDLSRLAPPLAALKAKDHLIRSRMQSVEPGRFVLVHAPSLQAALQANEQATRVLAGLERRGKLEKYYSLYPWIASDALQRRNLEAFRHQMTPKSLARWRQALDAAGLNSAVLGQPAPPGHRLLSMADVAASPAAHLIAGQVVNDGRETVLTIWLGRHDPASLRAALAGIPDVSYVSQKSLMRNMNAGYRRKAIKALGLGSLFIFIMLAFRYRSPRMAVRALGPAMVSVAVVFGCWGISGRPLSMLHLVGMLLAVSICVDYGIFFVENRAHDMRLTYEAIVASALTTIVSFSCLGLAENPALKILAWTVAPGVFLGFFLCPILIRTPTAGLSAPREGQ